MPISSGPNAYRMAPTTRSSLKLFLLSGSTRETISTTCGQNKPWQIEQHPSTMAVAIQTLGLKWISIR